MRIVENPDDLDRRFNQMTDRYLERGYPREVVEGHLEKNNNQIIMNNETSVKYFYILPFSGETRNNPFISTFFFLIYLVGVLVNSSIIAVICLEVQLHKPMYLFICNLSIVDIFYTSVTVPKLLHMLLSGNYIVSFSQCYTQLYFFLVVASAEEILLFIMAYDRYVAICIPLHYHRILSLRNCTLISFGIWASAVLNASLYIILALNMFSCHSNVIHQFFCDIKSLTKINCTTTQMFFILTGIETLLFAFIPFMCTFISYIKIFSVIFKMKSREGRKKAFSTCSSHITVMSVYYGTSVTGYLTPAYSDVLDLVFNVVYTTITPMINPLIYSLQNSNVQSALLGFGIETREIARLISCRWRPGGIASVNIENQPAGISSHDITSPECSNLSSNMRCVNLEVHGIRELLLALSIETVNIVRTEAVRSECVTPSSGM
ncbi:olfactory receptor 1A1-like [Rhinoderma darwinii]|uniref:olfactory receptor 1A1-like n=1 Tax=Rhinoderma darwinii TaxID=43563 RepID=UPI003F66F17B